MRNSAWLAVLGLSLPCGSARAEEGVTETWERVHISGARAGFGHSRTRTVGEATKQVETQSRSELSLTRMGQTIEIASTSTTLETPEGNLQRIESISKQSAQESTTVYTFEGGKLTIATQVMGETRTVESKVPADLVGPARAQAESRRLAGTTGEVYAYTTFMPDFQSVVETTLTSKGLEPVTLHDGSTVQATRVDAALTMANGTPLPLSPVVWMDASGVTLKTRLEAGGLLIESYGVKDEAAAKGEGEAATGPAPDVFLQTLIQEHDPIPVPRRLEEAWIVVKGRKPGVALPDLADEGHHVTPQKDGSVLVHALRRTPPADKRGLRPLVDPSPDLADALAPGSSIQSDAPEIVQIAQATVGEERCAWVAAQRLERWVAENITVKSMGVAFGSALEACRDREGDCTEHAVLLAALCRAAGIPARVLMGLEYLHGIWGGHAWNEVWIEGSWYALDATNGYGFVDPLHLPLAHMVMKEGAASELVQLMAGIGSLDVDIQEVMRDGRRIRVDDPALVTTTAGTYSNRVLSLAFTVPAGYELDPPRKRPGLSTRVMDIEGQTAEGRGVDIEIDMLDAPAAEGWEAVFKQLGSDGAHATRRLVDGRPARSLTESRNGRAQTRVLVLADGALWIVTLDRAGGEAEESAFKALLESLDFDVR